MSDVLNPFPHLKIRSATNEDTVEIQKLVFGVLEEYGLVPSPESTDADLANIEGSYIKPGGLFEVVLDGKKIVGTIGLFPVDETTCELRKMYLLKTARGHGLGRYVLQRVVERARELGFKQIVLETSSKLAIAIQLYKNFGFHQITMDHPSARADQAYAMDL